MRFTRPSNHHKYVIISERQWHPTLVARE